MSQMPHQPLYGCEYPEELSRCVSAKGRGLLTCHTRTMGMRDDTKRTVVVLRSVACAESMYCVFFAVCGHVSTLLVSSFCVSILREGGKRIVIDRVNQVPFERSGPCFYMPVASVFSLVGSSPRSSCF